MRIRLFRAKRSFPEKHLPETRLLEKPGQPNVCREQAHLVAAGVRTVVFADNEEIGTVRPNMFVHTTLEPGKHGILL
jgi:hypothetical protein